MAIINGVKVKIFTLNSNPALAKEIAGYVGIELSKCEISRFADGEVQIDIPETVRGHSVCCSINKKPVNENYMELLIMIDALKRASARSINVIMPYYGYSRQTEKQLLANRSQQNLLLTYYRLQELIGLSAWIYTLIRSKVSLIYQLITLWRYQYWRTILFNKKLKIL